MRRLIVANDNLGQSESADPGGQTRNEDDLEPRNTRMTRKQEKKKFCSS